MVMDQTLANGITILLDMMVLLLFLVATVAHAVLARRTGLEVVLARWVAVLLPLAGTFVLAVWAGWL
jgi:hypothetical protein